MSRAGLGALALPLALAVAAPANATGVDRRPELATMPEVVLPAALDAAVSPDRIPAGEAAEGVAIQPRHAAERFVSFTGSGKACVKAGFAAPADGSNPGRDGSTTGFLSGGRVMPLRTEQLVVAADGAASLEIIDGWIDPTTAGVRIEKKTRVPLVTLATGPLGYSVYGFRTGETLAVVVPAAMQLLYRGPDSGFRSASCDHARIELEAEKGSAATFVAAGFVEAPAERPGMPAGRRAIQVSASLSRTSRDPAPVLSVTAGFADEAPAPALPLLPEEARPRFK